MQKVIIKDKEYALDLSSNNSLISGKINHSDFIADILSISDDSFHVIRNNQSYSVEVSKIYFDEKKVDLKVNGKNYTVSVLSELDILLKEMGMDNLAAKKIKELKAPMPGLVLDVLVNEGDEVNGGDKLLVLEAMKMENNLKAEGDAKVKAVKCKKGQAVEKNEVLIVFE